MDAQNAAIETSRWRIFWRMAKLRLQWWRQRNIPYLVWYNDELDVRVTFTENRLPKGLTLDPNKPASVVRHLKAGALPKIEEGLRDLGVTFDTGVGDKGRDWEWDFSLSGPISVRFNGRASKPERRT